MCGISGFYKINKDYKYIGETVLHTMNAQMINRGPDGEGVWLQRDNICGLGHRRLAIVDLSAEANQPMLSSDGNVTIAFNGEIYNHEEIRKDLIKTGKYEWRTDHSDTEVIIYAYKEWGIGCLQHFRGMFAIALWDAKQRELYLIRDRIGIKPLYYTVEDGVLYFASEIKAILPILKERPKVDPVALYDYFSFLTTPGEQTLFKNIKKIRPASYLKIDANGRVGINEYWDVWDHTRPELYYASDAEVTEAVLSELKQAIKLRKRSDVPVGVFLSGGIDSSTNVALFSEDEKTDVKTFSIGYDKNYKSYHSETRYAREMAEYCGTDHHELLLAEEDMLSFVKSMVRIQDEPISDPVCMPVYYLSKMAKENGVTVAQVGEGADELFWGYDSWRVYLGLSRCNRIAPRSVKALGLRVLENHGKGGRFYTELLRRGVEGLPVFWSGAEAFNEYEKQRMLSGEVLNHNKNRTSWDAISHTWKRFIDNAWEISDLNWMSYADLRHRIPELLLMRVDKMSMAVSLECRVPFLDHRLVEIAMSISQKKKTANNKSKIVLKRCINDIVPSSIINRKKQGFGVPLYDWSMSRLGAKMDNSITSFAEESGLLNTQFVRRMIDDCDDIRKKWYLFNLALWWEAFIK